MFQKNVREYCNVNVKDVHVDSDDNLIVIMINVTMLVVIRIS